MAQEKEIFKNYRDEMERLIHKEAGRKDDVVSKTIVDKGEAGTKLQEMRHQPDLITSEDMLQTLSEQAGIPFIHLSDYPLDDLKILKQIPAQIARDYKVFPVREDEEGTLVVAISDPLNITIVDDLRLLLDRSISPVVASEDEITDHIDQYYGMSDESIEKVVEELEKDADETQIAQQFQELDLSDIQRIANEPPVVQLVNLILLQAIKDRASDLHLEPFSGGLRIRYRVDGMLREISSPPKSLQLGVSSRIKVMANLDIAETRLPQDGRIRLNIQGREIDLRVATIPTVHGEGIVMRILDKAMMMLGIEQLGMTKDALARYQRAIKKPNGIILVTGPTGSGKTTTLYAAVQEINSSEVKLITVEDPVEYEVPGLIQVNVNPNVKLTFARCLRHIVRQDPDIILVGEVRDLETAQISIQASLTGHLVLSTLHTTSAAATVTRLIDMGVEPFLLTSTLEAVIGQRLIRLICNNCKAPYTPTQEELADFGVTPDEVKDIVFYQGEGCEDCNFSGYRGRIGIFEIMVLTDEIRELILERATAEQIHAMAIHQGMQTMRNDGWLKICMGWTTPDEVARQTPAESQETIGQEMERMVKETVERVRGKKKTLGDKEILAAPTPSVPLEETKKRPVTPWEDEAATSPYSIGDAEKSKKDEGQK